MPPCVFSTMLPDLLISRKDNPIWHKTNKNFKYVIPLIYI